MNKKEDLEDFRKVIDETAVTIDSVLAGQETELEFHESGTVCFVGKGIVRIKGCLLYTSPSPRD